MKKTIAIIGGVYMVICIGMCVYMVACPEGYGKWIARFCNGMFGEFNMLETEEI